jgi:acyl carrier protein
MNDDYELKILANVVCRYLNEKPIKEADLSRVKSNLDDIVWEFAVRFYNESGHKAEFIDVRTIVDSWVKSKKEELTQKKIMDASLQKPKVFPELPSGKLNLSDKMNHSDNQHKKSSQNKPKEIPRNFDENEERAKIFREFADLVSEQFKVTPDLVTLDTNLSDFLGIDDFDFMELHMMVEEEFGIEIADAEVEDKLGILSPEINICAFDFRIFPWDKKPKKRTEKPTPPKLKSKYVMVKGFVDLIYEKLFV